MRLRSSSPVVVIAVLLTGCAPPPYTPPDTGSTEPSITVTWPLPESTAVGCTVVTVEIKNLTLTDFATNTTDVPGEGHYHVTTPLGYTPVYTPYALISWLDQIPDSNADLTVQLVNNIHEPLLDANGDPYQVTIPLHYVPSATCAEFGSTPTDTAYDSGMGMDSGS